MNYLIDTHTLLWFLVATEKLSQPVKDILLDPDSKIFISIISLWEISLKYSIGKLKIKGKKPDEIPETTRNLGLDFLNLDPEVALSFYKMPIKSNKDPFDLMLAWQAINEKFTLLSKDKGFDAYKKTGLKRVW